MALPAYTDVDIQDALRYIARLVNKVPSINDYDNLRERILLKWFGESPQNLLDYLNPDKVGIFPLPSVVAIRTRFKELGGWAAAVAFLSKDFSGSGDGTDSSFLRSLLGSSRQTLTESEYDEARSLESPDSPSAAVLAKSFGSWKHALESAGIEPTHYRSWSRDEQVAMAVILGIELGGRMPSVSEFDRAARDRGWPWARQLYREFRSWPELAALALPRIQEAAKLGVEFKPILPSEEIVSRRRPRKPVDLSPLKELTRELGRYPHMKEYQQARKGTKWPSAREMKKRFETWAAVCEAAQAIAEPSLKRAAKTG